MSALYMAGGFLIGAAISNLSNGSPPGWSLAIVTGLILIAAAATQEHNRR